MTEDRLTELRDKLFRACEGHDADESIRAMGSALTTMSPQRRRRGFQLSRMRNKYR